MEMVQFTLKHWKVWLPFVWFWGNILYLAFLTLGTLFSIHQGQVGPKKINRTLKRWITVAALLLLRELLEPILTPLHHSWFLLILLGTLSFLENLKLLNSVIYERLIKPILNSREQDIDLFLYRLSFHYLNWKTAFLQLVAYCSSELLRRTAHYLVVDTELSRKLSSLEVPGNQSTSYHNKSQEPSERKFLPKSYTENDFVSFANKQEMVDKKDSAASSDENYCLTNHWKSVTNKPKPYERIHELRTLLKQQKSRRNSAVSEKAFG